MTATTFSLDEYARRLVAVQGVLRERQLDWAILDEPETMGWLSGFSVSENLWRACVVPAEGAPFLLVRKLDISPAREKSWVERIVGFADWEDPVSVLAAELKQRAGRDLVVGVDFQSNSFTRQREERLESVLPHAALADLDRSIWDLRRLKSVEEIRHMSHAAHLVDHAFVKVLGHVRAGCTRRELAGIAAEEYYRLGFDDGFVGYITAGSSWDSLHGFVSDDPLEIGAVVHVELLPRLNGYSARLMRSVVVGAATPAQSQAFARTATQIPPPMATSNSST